jgi:uroporphyrinogen decarboxylase
MTSPLPDHTTPAFRRVQAALQGQPADRIPLTLWQRSVQEERSPEALATAAWEFGQELSLDLITLTPGTFYAVEDWGAEIQYPRREDSAPYIKRPVIQNPHDWRELMSLDASAGALGRTMETVRVLRALTRGQGPLMLTIFSPLTIAYQLAGEKVIEHLRQEPQALHIGLAIITETTARVAKKALASGAHGVFFAAQMASRTFLTEAEYEVFGVHYDLMVLESVAPRSTISALHLYGKDVFFDLVNRYPVQAVSWDHLASSPTLAEARQRTDKALMGGLDRELLRTAPVHVVSEQVHEVIRQAGESKLILAASGALLPGTPRENLLAVRQVVRSTTL